MNNYQPRAPHPGRPAVKPQQQDVQATSCNAQLTPGEGMRIGQALGLRHADFISHRKEVRIVPRRDNANGARAKTLEEHTIPIRLGWCGSTAGTCSTSMGTATRTTCS